MAAQAFVANVGEKANTIAAQFRVSGVLKLRSRHGIFVCGEVVTGSITSGMTIEWPIHGDAITTSLPIHHVEFVDYWPNASGLALGVRFDSDELENEEFLRHSLEVGMVVPIWSVAAH